jgi:hypothetical protein
LNAASVCIPVGEQKIIRPILLTEIEHRINQSIAGLF